MFSKRKKQKFQINPDDLVFNAVYLGKIEIPSTRQPSNVLTAVRTLWDRAHAVGPERLPRVSLSLGPSGIFMEDERAHTSHKYQFSINNISYCMANKGFKCVFSWVVVGEPGRRLSSASITSAGSNHGNGMYGGSDVIVAAGESERSKDVKNPRCHVVVCEREDLSRAMALLMTGYFKNAYRDHKSKERLETRKQTTLGMIGDLENHASTSDGGGGSFDDVNSPSTSCPVSRHSSSASRMSGDSGDVSPIHAMVARAFGVTQRSLSEPDAAATTLQAAEERLRTLRIDPAKISERGEVETLFDWVPDKGEYQFYETK